MKIQDMQGWLAIKIGMDENRKIKILDEGVIVDAASDGMLIVEEAKNMTIAYFVAREDWVYWRAFPGLEDLMKWREKYAPLNEG